MEDDPPTDRELEDDPLTERELEDDPLTERVSVLPEVEDDPPAAPALAVLADVADDEEEVEGLFDESAAAEEAANAAVALGFLMRWTNGNRNYKHVPRRDARSSRFNSFSR